MPSKLGGVSEPLRFDPIAEAERHWAERWGAEPARAMSAITSVMRAEQILSARLNALLEPFGLTFPRYEALMLLYLTRRGSLPMGKIGARLQVHRTSVTNLIDGLEREGLVSRAPHESDRRTVLASITPEGRRRAEEATAVLNSRLFETDGLGEEELDALTDVLGGFRAAADGIPLGTTTQPAGG
jgi:DNA-binding MarR family transcriptional regulator